MREMLGYLALLFLVGVVWPAAAAVAGAWADESIRRRSGKANTAPVTFDGEDGRK